MEYRKFGDLGFSVSTFGLGTMRLPLLDGANGDQSKVDEEESIKIIRYAIDNGVNYIDTAYLYHDGISEIVVGKALKDGYREKVKLTTKLPVWIVNSYEDFSKYLDDQLKKLDVEYIDFYLLHALTKKLFDNVINLKVFDFLEEAKKQGKIKHIGFSFHDELDVFKEIIDCYNWDMCQIQLNILDETYQAGIEGLKYAGSKGIPVVIMEPLKGGILAKHIPDEVRDIYEGYPVKLTPVEWAFNWVTNFDEVVTVLSGISTMEQTIDNIRIFSKDSKLLEEDFELIEKVKNKYEEKIKVGCTGCNYCMPCPSNVIIPEVFRTYNYSSMFDYETYKKEYLNLAENDLVGCIECGNCESLCPQNIKIIDTLKDVSGYFS